MVKDSDSDGSGTIEFNEFVSMMVKLNTLDPERVILDAFRILDIDGKVFHLKHT